ncbi:hypothetical protein CLF_110786, partial [Clonorchis sinensis]
MALPKIGTDKFDGTPRRFWKFMKSFQVNLASRLADDIATKLNQFLERNLSAATNVCGQLAGGANGVSNWCVDDINQRSKLPRPHVNAVASQALSCPAKFSEEKLQALRECKLRFNCLKPNHRADKYRAPTRCDLPRCGKRHHRLLHMDSLVKPPTSSTADINSNSVEVPSAFLGFLPMRLLSPNGAVLCYALLDSGVNSTLSSLEVADRIGLKGTPTELEFKSINGALKKGTTAFSPTIESLNNDCQTHVQTAFSTDQLPLTRSTVPSREFLRRWYLCTRCTLGDRTTYRDQYTTVCVSLTVFGWVVLGPSGISGSKTTTINCLNTQETIESDILRLFGLEFIDQRPKRDISTSIEDKQVLSLAKQFRVSEWPKTEIEQLHHKPVHLELKRAATVMITATTDLPTDVLFSEYSSWVRLRRAIAWFTRFKSYLHSKIVGKGNEFKSSLRLDKLNEAERSISRYVQLKTFPSVLSTTSQLDSKPCKGLCRKSPICKLHPIVLNGLLCVSGQLGNSPLPEFTKHPIIRPGDHPVTRGIINHYHEFEGHMGNSHTLAAIRQGYWILSATTAVKQLIRGCVGCQV